MSAKHIIDRTQESYIQKLEYIQSLLAGRLMMNDAKKIDDQRVIFYHKVINLVIMMIDNHLNKENLDIIFDIIGEIK
jgi:hypothetical protein